MFIAVRTSVFCRIVRDVHLALVNFSCIHIRLRGDDPLDCPKAIADTTAGTPLRLSFARVGNKLSVSVNGATVCSKVMKLRPDVSKFITAPLRFGGNHQNANGQNLNVVLSDIVITASTFCAAVKVPTCCHHITFLH